MLSRQGVTQVIFDKDRGLEILVRALGGEYCPLRNGEPTGFNPLKLPPTPLNTEFLKSWLRVLVQTRGRRADACVRRRTWIRRCKGTLALDPQARRLSRLMEFLDSTDPKGCIARLAPWCECVGATTRGSSTTPRMSSCRACHSTPWWGSTSRISWIMRCAARRSRSTSFIWSGSCWMAGSSCAGWTSSGACWPIPPLRTSPRTGPRPGGS